jgi:hypothetical protein
MEKYPDLFDRSIKEAMKGHGLTPSGEARKAFLDEASTVLPARRRWKNWYLLPLAIIFIVAVVALLWNETSQQSTVGSQQSVVVGQQSAVGGKQSAVGGRQSSAVSQEHQNNIKQDISKAIDNQNINKIQSNTQYPIPDTQYPTPVISQQSAVSSQQLAVGGQQSAVSSQQSAVSSNQSSITSDQQPVTSDQQPVTSDQPLVTSDQLPVTVDQPPVTSELKWHIASGVYYNPELMFNTLEDNKFVNNFGLDAIFYHGLVSIRTGLGLSISKGITENSIDYNSYLGSYNKLDSVTFSYSEDIHNFVPQIYTTSQKVWDTAVNTDSDKIYIRYTYLQVPLVLGFDFWQRNRISIGVRVGTIMSVMLASKQLTGEYDPGQNQVVGISTLTPSQVSLNWQAVGGISASAVLTKKIGLEIEPQARYYYGSIYEKSSDNKKPWSVGIRLALLYKF